MIALTVWNDQKTYFNPKQIAVIQPYIQGKNDSKESKKMNAMIWTTGSEDLWMVQETVEEILAKM